ncbi:MAG: penicillin-binding protein activator [Gammaproteobacteria bacterium]|nr:penicillin-binding protein activator [Gammaproteobacteria bacterium]
MPERKKPDTIIEPAGKAQRRRLGRLGMALSIALLAGCAAGPKPEPAAEQRPAARAGIATAQLQRARAQLEARQGQAALAELSTVPTPEALPAAELQQYRELRAQALDLAGDWQGAAAERLALLRGTQGEGARAAREQLWRVLRRQRAESLVAARAAATDPELAGWLELAGLTATFAIDPARLNREVEAWRAAHAGHPAASTLPEELAEPKAAALLAYAPRQIALLLPQSGPLAATANLIRDGFLAAYYHRATAEQPQIRLYDTAAEDPLAAYARARAEGADFVVGPLEKEAVAKLNAATLLPLPTLSLNRSDKPGPHKSHFYQLGLIPEDEAMRLAERAAADGKRRALSLMPRNLLGQRLGQSLQTQFGAAGGQVAETVYFDRGPLMEGALKDGLGLMDSQRRFEAIKALTGLKLAFEARRRGDIDSLFLSASPEEARQLKPLLNFYNAGELQVYASNRLYAGDPTADRDLEGVAFPDQPWLIAQSAELAALRGLVRASLPAGVDKRQGRLFALGFDAYLLIPELHALHNQPGRRLAGLTGELELTTNGWLVQHQPWARIVRGEARLWPQAQP